MNAITQVQSCSQQVHLKGAQNYTMEKKQEELLVNLPKTARGQETLNRICQAAEQLFAEKGYYETAINDITSLAGISAGTFYIYFESKLALYRYILSQSSHRIRKHLSMAVAHCTSRREIEREGLRAWLQFVTENKYVFNITWESLFIDKRLFDEYYAAFSTAYVQRLKEAQEAGEIKDIDLEVLSFVLMGLSNFLGLHWAVFKEGKDLDYVVDEAMKFIDGIFPAEA